MEKLHEWVNVGENELKAILKTRMLNFPLDSQKQFSLQFSQISYIPLAFTFELTFSCWSLIFLYFSLVLNSFIKIELY